MAVTLSPAILCFSSFFFVYPSFFYSNHPSLLPVSLFFNISFLFFLQTLLYSTHFLPISSQHISFGWTNMHTYKNNFKVVGESKISYYQLNIFLNFILLTFTKPSKNLKCVAHSETQTLLCIRLGKSRRPSHIYCYCC